MYKKEFMELAVKEARRGIINGDGGPFGAVIVKDGVIIASGHNRVLEKDDSTCHGEIDAIRKAEQKLDTHDLSGCQLYTTGEPCPMCLAAIRKFITAVHLKTIKKLVFAMKNLRK